MRKLITSLTVLQLYLSWARSIQSMPHPTPWRSILILFSHLRLGLTSSPFRTCLLTKTLCAPHLSPISAKCTAFLIILDLTTRIIYDEEYRSESCSLCIFFHSHLTLSFLGPHIPHSTLFSNTLSRVKHWIKIPTLKFKTNSENQINSITSVFLYALETGQKEREYFTYLMTLAITKVRVSADEV